MVHRAGALSRRNFLRLSGLVLGGVLLNRIGLAKPWIDWRSLLPLYEASARRNIVSVNGRRAMLSARLYPGIYIRDALFWGPLALGDAALGYECYRWFAESQLESGQIRSAVPLDPEDAGWLEPKDDEGGLLFVIAADWLRQHGYRPDAERIERAYGWVQEHVRDHAYISPRGPFCYWADTVSPDVDEVISYNQGLLCLCRRAMVNMGLGGVGEADVAAAQARYRGFYAGGYVRLGRYSHFAAALDNSAVFPEFLSRYLYGESILADGMVLGHVRRLVERAAVYRDDGILAGIKVISSATGEFLPPEWFFAPEINSAGNYQNGGYWPMYTLVALALAYQIGGDESLARLAGQLVVNELGSDPRSKEIIQLAEEYLGSYDPDRTDYTWNALIGTACQWGGLV
jgi:hypothetical protein